MSGTEYRVVWYREGVGRKVKRFASLGSATRRKNLLGPQPWMAYDKNPNSLWCCDGYQCNCGGLTVMEFCKQERDLLPKVESVHIERRQVGEWLPHD